MHNTIGSERTRLGLSQDQLGEMMGKDRATIGRWEKNPGIVDGAALIKLSQIFGCTVDYLLNLTPERTPRATA